ncbi:hypothetical protein, partial [Candidatus Venteria ishoeyi]|uniref:hypothetical protein n=1 Tax=Candidatus Venteria ishoeyi TaxID=1899563 RepID=UPI000CDE5996
IVVINIKGLFTNEEIGPPFIQTVDYCIWMSVMGVVISLKQWFLLRKQFKVSSLWVLACVGGVIIGESLAGIVLWRMGINRADLGWPQGGSILAETLIFLFSGAIIGLFQFPLLKRNYNRAGLWLLVCCIGWRLIPMLIYIFGGIVFGAITGTTLIWIMKKREVES